MNYSKNYRILKLDSSILGYRATEKEAIALALRQSERLSESIEIKKRNAQGICVHFTISLNPEKFVEY